MANKTRIMKLSDKFLAQRFYGWWFIGEWASYSKDRSGGIWFDNHLEHLLRDCLHDTVAEAQETIRLMQIVHLAK